MSIGFHLRSAMPVLSLVLRFCDRLLRQALRDDEPLTVLSVFHTVCWWSCSTKRANNN